MKTAEKEIQAPSLEQLILDNVHGKYQLVLMAIRWAYEIQKQEQFRGKPFSQVVDAALTDLLQGSVKLSEVEKLPTLKKGGEPLSEPENRITAGPENGAEKAKKEKK